LPVTMPSATNFIKFLDPTRCNSQAVFAGDDETLESGQSSSILPLQFFLPGHSLIKFEL